VGKAGLIISRRVKRANLFNPPEPLSNWRLELRLFTSEYRAMATNFYFALQGEANQGLGVT
jgi:hypothetical protein